MILTITLLSMASSRFARGTVVVARGSDKFDFLCSRLVYSTGVMIPFKMVSNNVANGDIVLIVKDVKWNVDVPDAVFRKPVKK